MKKFCFLSIIALSLLLTAWLIPVKVFWTNPALQNIKRDMQSNIVLICTYQATTGPTWNVEEYEGINECPPLIDIIGEDIPELKLKSPIYEYNNCKFIFIGRFDPNNKALFQVEKWNILAPVWGKLNCLPYGINVFQYNFIISEESITKRESLLREYHEQYEQDI